jgi:predicted PurR-regulated permease PerM
LREARGVTIERRALFWIGAAIVALLVLYLLSPILLPFIAGIAIAYALDPAADWFQRRGFSRLWATLTILVIFVLVIALLLLTLVPVLVVQIGELIQNTPAYVERVQILIVPLLDTDAARFLKIDPESLRKSISDFFSQGTGWVTPVLGSVWTGSLAIINIISLLVITPVVAFYLLYDWDRMVGRIDALLPRQYADTIRMLVGEISETVAGFVRGQGLLCLFLGVFYAAGLALLGVEFGLLIGLGAGLISFIPFIGSILGFVVSVGVALVQFWPDWIWIAATAGLFILGQFIEGNILAPKLVGGRVGLHPVWLIFALFAFGYFFGFVGLLIAVPVAASIGVLVRFAIKRYQASPLYSGDDTGSGP